MGEVLLTAPDGQRGSRQRDGENGGEQYDSSHSRLPVVANGRGPTASPSIRPHRRGFNQRASDERDGGDHGGQGRAAHGAEEERLGRVERRARPAAERGAPPPRRGARARLASAGSSASGSAIDEREPRAAGATGAAGAARP